jgi:Outer membrane protein beta-barrel domain
MIRHHFLFACCLPLALSAQVAINPQAGIGLTTLTPEREGAQYKASVGVLAGADLRIGQRFYFQPGALFVSSNTAVSVGDSLVTEDHLIFSSLKVKALLGYNLINGDDLRLRFNAGPTYNWLLNATGKDEKIKVEMEDFNSGWLNIDAGLGIDLTIFTVESGISYGLSKAYKEQDGVSADERFITYYVTAGVVLGGSTR